MPDQMTEDTFTSERGPWQATPEEPIECDEVEPKPRPGLGMRILRKTAILPASCTLMNGLCGFAAIHFAAKGAFGASMADMVGNMQWACILLIAAMVFDMFDGRLARMTRQTTEFGAQLDSLCDVISFGVAPAFLALRLTISLLREYQDWAGVERAVWVISAIYLACAVLRLARFNVETDADESSHMDFHGLPSPGAAAALVSTILLMLGLWQEPMTWLPRDTVMVIMSIVLPLLTLAVGLLMVSRFEYPHIINHYIRGSRPFGYLVKLVFLLIPLVLVPLLTIALVAVIYAASGPIRAGIRRLVRR